MFSVVFQTVQIFVNFVLSSLSHYANLRVICKSESVFQPGKGKEEQLPTSRVSASRPGIQTKQESQEMDGDEELEASTIMLAVTYNLSLGTRCQSAMGVPTIEQPALIFYTHMKFFK